MHLFGSDRLDLRGIRKHYYLALGHVVPKFILMSLFGLYYGVIISCISSKQ